MKFSLTKEVSAQIQQIKKKNPKLYKKIQKQLYYFLQNHKHPSLRNHKLKGHLLDRRSITIEGNLRMLYYVDEGKSVFFMLGTHDQVYRM